MIDFNSSSSVSGQVSALEGVDSQAVEGLRVIGCKAVNLPPETLGVLPASGVGSLACGLGKRVHLIGHPLFHPAGHTARWRYQARAKKKTAGFRPPLPKSDCVSDQKRRFRPNENTRPRVS